MFIGAETSSFMKVGVEGIVGFAEARRRRTLLQLSRKLAL